MADKTLAEQYRILLLLRIKIAEMEKDAAARELQRMDDKQKEQGQK